MDTALIGLISLVVTSLTALGLAWIGLKQSELSKKQNEITQTITTLEKNTNSIKDALIISTAEKSHAEGKLEGRKEQSAIDVANAAIRAQGVLEGQTKVTE